jgi:hypothetical protein
VTVTHHLLKRENQKNTTLLMPLAMTAGIYLIHGDAAPAPAAGDNQPGSENTTLLMQ